MPLTPKEPRTFRATPSAYVVLGGVAGAIFVLCVHTALAVHPSFRGPALLSGALFLFVVFWLRAFEIRIAGEELVFRSLFGGTRRIRYDDIGTIRFGVNISPYEGPVRLTVTPRQTGNDALSINAKVFSREAIRAVLDLEPGRQSQSA